MALVPLAAAAALAVFVVPAQPAAAVVGGTAAAQGQFPAQLAITVSGRLRCGGALVGADTVVTTAGCVSGVNASSLQIVAGEWQLDQVSGTEQRRVVADVVIHPDYNAATHDSDLAVLHVSQPFVLNQSVAPITLVPQGSDPVPLLSGDITTAGWGTTSENGSPSNTLHSVQEPVIARTVCALDYGLAVTGTMFCGGHEFVGGSGFCQGDEGGLAVINGRLAGLPSWHRGCARPGSPDVYTRIGAFTNWIHTHTT
ncbi:serine protease [Streptomyces sp. NPDC051578]|uniref:serine protease n=1 Tax=Streptomyces sp. NPDC051578 TaxID=3365662 RepID=UPI00378AF3E1